MANRWVYRRQDVYWIANQEAVYTRKRLDQSSGVDISTQAPLDTPPLWNQRRQQQQYRWRTRRSLVHFGAATAERRLHASPPAGPTVYQLSLSGTFT